LQFVASASSRCSPSTPGDFNSAAIESVGVRLAYDQPIIGKMLMPLRGKISRSPVAKAQGQRRRQHRATGEAGELGQEFTYSFGKSAALWRDFPSDA
jgi:hypothetical protein